MTAAAAAPVTFAAARRALRRNVAVGAAVMALALAYLAYSWVAFDAPSVIAKADPERAVLLGVDAVAHKTHVVKDLRRGGIEVAIEGERTATYKTPPAWVGVDGDDAAIDLGDGYGVRIVGKTAAFAVPDYGDIVVTVGPDGVETAFPGPAPAWARATSAKFDARPTLFKRLQVSRSKIEVHRYAYGWENFFFPFASELNAYSAGELLDLALSGERMDPARSNAALIAKTFLDNPEWQHREVMIALFETIMMAALGTATAAIFGLPLAFLAARNFTPSGWLRFGVRRLFDFLRGIDMLIWSLIFIRAFGLGPLTGALAIAFTDAGTLGKLFSEALENVDEKQAEGVRATGASQLQRYRFGVIPQILPVLVSQSLYYLESNTRSATVIGALGAGGIGLLLVETMRTARDWENVVYLIGLTICLVFLMDWASTALRRRLIHGKR